MNKRILQVMALAAICVVSHLISDAQSVTVYLKDGTSVTYNEARFDHLQLNSKKGDEGEVYVILGFAQFVVRYADR